MYITGDANSHTIAFSVK